MVQFSTFREILHFYLFLCVESCRGRGRYNNGHMRHMGDEGMRYRDQQPLLQNPQSAPTKILINPHFKGPRPLLNSSKC
jgi:hypothetical protein